MLLTFCSGFLKKREAIYMPSEICEVDAKGRMLVKSWVRKTLGISPGDKLLLRLSEDSFVVEKVSS